jgi:tetratricopeptide (TPR) repeat protein
MNSVKRTNLNKAIEIGEKGLQVAHETNDTIMLAAISRNISSIFVNMGKYDSAKIYIQEAIQWYRFCGREIEILWCRYNLAKVYSYQDFYDTAINEYQNILQSPHIDENNELYSFVLGEMGTLYYRQALYHKAVEAYSKARSFFINDTARFITASINLGAALSGMNMYDSSIIVLQEGLEYAEKSNWTLKKAALLTNISLNWAALGRFNDAVVCIDEAIIIREEAADSLGLSYSYRVKGDILVEKGAYDLANDYFFRSLKIDESLNIPSNIAETYCLIGECLQYKQEHEAALAYFGQGYEISVKIGVGGAVESALRGSALSWMALNDAKKAADFMKRYISAHDSISRMDDVGYHEQNMPPSLPKESENPLKQLLTYLGFSFLICWVILLLYRNRGLKAVIKKSADEKNL